MALNGDDLGDEMLAAIDGVGDKTDRTALFRALGNKIVDHIKANSQITFRTIDGGAQVSTTAGLPTSAPAAPVTFSAGQIS